MRLPGGAGRPRNRVSFARRAPGRPLYGRGRGRPARPRTEADFGPSPRPLGPSPSASTPPPSPADTARSGTDATLSTRLSELPRASGATDVPDFSPRAQVHETAQLASEWSALSPCTHHMRATAFVGAPTPPARGGAYTTSSRAIMSIRPIKPMGEVACVTTFLPRSFPPCDRGTTNRGHPPSLSVFPLAKIFSQVTD